MASEGGYFFTLPDQRTLNPLMPYLLAWIWRDMLATEPEKKFWMNLFWMTNFSPKLCFAAHEQIYRPSRSL